MNKGDLVYVLFAIVYDQVSYVDEIGEIVEIATRPVDPVIALRFSDGEVIMFYTNQVNKLFDV